MNEACPLPTPPSESEDAIIRRLLAAQRIAIVGLSDNPSRVSFAIAEYLLGAAKEVVPVNPTHSEVLGLTCYARLEDVPGQIDLVNVFRRPEFCGDVARSAVAIAAGGIWLQSGIRSAEAKELARQANIPYIENRCIMVEHMHHR
ncbi:MAG TPA: CoA-binding protein [Tepidisphaeraceae bacterium]|nr:CoA-binding protein [Tepidisphaeraceae bacterium]